MSRAAAGAGLGLVAATLLVANPAMGLLPLVEAGDAAYAAPGLLGAGFAGLSAAAFLASALGAGRGSSAGGRRVSQRVSVPAVVRRPPRRLT